MPVISVIIPVYNGAKTIRQTIESVLNQTFRDFELIIVNDGSTDKTLEVISSFKDLRIHVFSYQNAGLSESRNRGIGLAAGEFLSFIDADDLWAPLKLEVELETLRGNPEASVVYSWLDYIDENGDYLKMGCHFLFSGSVYKDLLLMNFVGSGSNIMVRKQVLNSLDTFDETLDAAADWDFCLKLAECHRFVVVPLVHVFYRQSSNSMCSDVYRLEKACLKVIERHFKGSSLPLHLQKKSKSNIYAFLAYKTLIAKGSLILKSRSFFKFVWKCFVNDPFSLKFFKRFFNLLKIFLQNWKNRICQNPF